ncbi:hypothetical protein [Halorientalis halophila]|uniref:hypothetical protein n=1 Tax=Halorientalis halophila TaxID=3108499 RepID=UPI00300BC565
MTSGSRQSLWQRYVAKLLLSVGFLSLTVAILGAFSSPPEGYELSIYAGTPTVFWVGAGVALAVALALSLLPAAGRYTAPALYLGGATLTAVVGLPLLRGYAFAGPGDPATHLGWIRDIEAGKYFVTELLYTGLHSTALVFHDVVGTALEHSLLLAMVAFTIPFFVFTPLIVRTVSSRPQAVPIAAFSSFLLLPITNLETFNRVHPYTQAMFFTPLVIYVALRFVFDPRDSLASPFSLLLALTSVALVFGHPLQALNVILLFVGITVVQFLSGSGSGEQDPFRYASLGGRRPIAVRSLLVHTVFVIGVFFAWVVRTEQFQTASRTYVPSILEFVQGSATAGRETASQASSLSAIGASPAELLVRMFPAALLYVALAGLFVLLNIHGRFRHRFSASRRYLGYGFMGILTLLPLSAAIYARPLSSLLSGVTGVLFLVVSALVGIGVSLLLAVLLLAYATESETAVSGGATDTFVTYMAVGGAFAVPLFFLFFVGNIASLYFRILGYLLLIATLLGSLGLVRFGDGLGTVVSRRTVRIGVVLLFVVLLPLTVVTVFSSPYLYLSNHHVSQQQFDGYATTFEHRDPDVPVAGIRQGPYRYAHAVEGYEAAKGKYERSVTGENLTRLPAASPGPLYLVVNERNRQRETEVFRELRYSKAQFRSLDHQRGVDRVSTTGEYDLYLAR